MENETQAEPVAAESTAPVEAPTESGETDKIRSTMEASYDRASARMPSDAELTKYQNHELPTTTTEETAEQSETADAADYPPQSWKAEMHAAWSQIPPEAKAYINQREVEMQRAISKYGELVSQSAQISERMRGELAAATEVGKVVESFRDSIPRLPDGQEMPPHSVLQTLLQANRILNERPLDAIRYLAQGHGVDLAKLAEVPVDPIEHMQRQAREQIEQARHQERAAIQAQLHEQYQRAQAAEEQRLSNLVGNFAASKDYWPAIESEIYYHVVALRAVNPEWSQERLLQEAHDKALAAHPDLDPKAKEKSQAELAELKRKAEQAKRLASMNVRSTTNGASPAPVNKDLVSTMTQVYERMNGR